MSTPTPSRNPDFANVPGNPVGAPATSPGSVPQRNPDFPVTPTPVPVSAPDDQPVPTPAPTAAS